MTSCRTHHSTYFMNYYPSIHLLYAFMSIISLHSILLWKSTKVWGLTEVGNSSAHLLILNYDSIQKCNKTLSSVVSVLATKWLGQLILPWCYHYIYLHGTLKGHGCALWNNLWSLVAYSRFIHPEQIYWISLQPKAGKGKKKLQLWHVLWKAAMNCLHKPSPEKEGVARPWDSFYMHQQLSVLLMNAHHVSHHQIPVDLLTGN